MRRVGWAPILVVLTFAAQILAQDSPTTPAQPPADSSTAPATAAPAVPAPSTPAPATVTTAPSTPPPPAATRFEDVIDRVVEREHLFLAQMRHMHPMVETYLQDLKNDGSGNAIPVNDRYFLGRLDMAEGPEDKSFVGQPGFGRRVVSKMTGIYSLHFLPLGFAQMVIID